MTVLERFKPAELKTTRIQEKEELKVKYPSYEGGRGCNLKHRRFVSARRKNNFIVTEGKKERTDVNLLIQTQKLPNMAVPLYSR